MVSRNYNFRFPTSDDFRDSLPILLKILESEKCDCVLFSPYSFSHDFHLTAALAGLKHIKMVVVERFDEDDPDWGNAVFQVYLRSAGRWRVYPFGQHFGTLAEARREKIDVANFARETVGRRRIGNTTLLFCGETNGVKYSKADKRVHDDFDVRAAIPKNSVVLNPVHDRMTRFEMRKKRQFLSRQGRTVISVWNKGKKFRNAKTKRLVERPDYSAPWTVYRNGRDLPLDIEVDSRSKGLNVEFAVVDID